ncbi:MAG: hypothetical protein CVU90_06420 [Firmicutes bacterium HGW-Firmicutes-15]|nr:MAG: hypothetical protein CVU90_06420 [Firmicutes bacterium HGW-Firmicutes-15]
MIQRIAEDIASHGGRAFYVGGYVRDQLVEIGTPNEEDIDIDIEVHFLNIEQLQSILSCYGTIHLVGKSFPVIKISGHPEWDFTVPAKSDISFAEACGRRDFTINSMMMDILSRDIIDIYGGRKDLESRIINAYQQKGI